MVCGEVVAHGIISMNEFNRIIFEERRLNIFEKLSEVFVVYTLDLNLSIYFEATVVIGDGSLQIWVVKMLRLVSLTIPHSLCQRIAYFDCFSFFINKLGLPGIASETKVLDQGWIY